jgi:hypothetical protein
MADTATDVRVVAAAEPGPLAAEANAAVRHLLVWQDLLILATAAP